MNILFVSPNKLYQVIELPCVGNTEDTGVLAHYGVQNIQTTKVEYQSNQLPQAIASAAQFDYMIYNDTWKGLLTSMFGDYDDENESLPTLEHDGRMN